MTAEQLWLTCKSCQKPFLKKEKTCPQCGAPNKQKRSILKWAAIGVGALVVISVIAGNSDKNATEPSAAASARTPSDPVVLAEDQKKFIETVNYYRTQFLSADNPLQESRFRNERKNAIRNLVGSGSINGWVGTIHSMNTTMDGKAIVEFRIDPNVLVGTWNNALSDIIDETLIPMDGHLFRSLEQMKVGDKIRFSGRFVPDDEDGIREGSVTIRGSMTEPLFLVKFTSVERG